MKTGAHRVADGVYRLPLPLPDAGLGAVNVYAIVNRSRVAIIDSGWGSARGEDVLEQGLAEIGYEFGDVTDFYCTHVHRDHYGGAIKLRGRFGARVHLGLGEEPSVRVLAREDLRGTALLADWLRRCGAAGLADEAERRGQMDNQSPGVHRPPDTWVVEGDQLAVGGRFLRAVETPGHTRGHVVFEDDEAGLLFAGDHVLPHITPSIGYEPMPSRSALSWYLRSLLRVRAMPDRLLLPAHGPVSPSVHERIDELLTHHETRLDETSTVLGTTAMTPFEVAQQLRWTNSAVAFGELDSFNQGLAVNETAAHLCVLARRGLAAEQTYESETCLALAYVLG